MGPFKLKPKVSKQDLVSNSSFNPQGCNLTAVDLAVSWSALKTILTDLLSP